MAALHVRGHGHARAGRPLLKVLGAAVLMQLTFAIETSHPNGARTVEQAGLRRQARPGPERLLRELVKRGLDEEALRPAAALVLALDEGANGKP